MRTHAWMDGMHVRLDAPAERRSGPAVKPPDQDAELHAADPEGGSSVKVNPTIGVKLLKARTISPDPDQ
jgi:hypothetical protein